MILEIVKARSDPRRRLSNMLGVAPRSPHKNPIYQQGAQSHLLAPDPFWALYAARRANYDSLIGRTQDAEAILIRC